MKKYLLLLLGIIIITGCKKENKMIDPTPSLTNTSIMELENYRDLKLEDVNSLDIIRYTVAGADKKTIYNQEEISNTYQMLKKVQIGEETKRACEDNTTVYVLYTKQGSKYSFEFECEWFVLKNKRYSIVR